MFKFKNLTNLSLFLLLFSFSFSCTSDSNDVENISSKEINIYLTDCPFDAEEVNVEILNIKIEEDDGDFFNMNTEAGVYNLLDFQNGVDVLIATGVLAIENIKNIYLELGDENTILIDGVLHPLIVNDDMVKVKFALGNILGNNDFLIEFYACNSIVEKNGEYHLKPVIKFKGERSNNGGGNILDLADLLQFFEDCYELVYPITIEDMNGELYPVNNKEELNDVLVNNDDLKLVYPVDLESNNGEIIEIRKEEEFESLALNCFETNNLSALEQILVKLQECYEVVYPISFVSQDGETFTANDEPQLVSLFNNEDIKDVVFPASLTDENGKTMTLNSYQDLVALIMDCQ